MKTIFTVGCVVNGINLLHYCFILFLAPSPPRNLKLQVKSSKSIEVSWEEPEKKNGNISNYIISYGKGDLEEDVYTTDTKYLLHNLEEFTLYFVRVAANTSIRGNHSAIQQARTLQDGKIPFDPHLCNYYSIFSSLEVSWVPWFECFRKSKFQHGKNCSCIIFC